jgi:hypothetical protein
LEIFPGSLPDCLPHAAIVPHVHSLKPMLPLPRARPGERTGAFLVNVFADVSSDFHWPVPPLRQQHDSTSGLRGAFKSLFCGVKCSRFPPPLL